MTKRFFIIISAPVVLIICALTYYWIIKDEEWKKLILPAEGESAKIAKRNVIIYSEIEKIVESYMNRRSMAVIRQKMERINKLMPYVNKTQIRILRDALMCPCTVNGHILATEFIENKLRNIIDTGVNNLPDAYIEILLADIFIVASYHDNLPQDERVINSTLLAYDICEAYCDKYKRHRTAYYYVQHAKYLGKLERYDDEIAQLDKALNIIGNNDNEDGSIYHEYGIVASNKGLKENNMDLCAKGLGFLEKAIGKKVKAGNIESVNYAKKLRLEIQISMAIQAKDIEFIKGLRREMEQCMLSWTSDLDKLPVPAKEYYPQVLMMSSFVYKCCGETKLSRACATKAMEAHLLYNNKDEEELKILKSMNRD